MLQIKQTVLRLWTNKRTFLWMERASGGVEAHPAAWRHEDSSPWPAPLSSPAPIPPAADAAREGHQAAIVENNWWQAESRDKEGAVRRYWREVNRPGVDFKGSPTYALFMDKSIKMAEIAVVPHALTILRNIVFSLYPWPDALVPAL